MEFETTVEDILQRTKEVKSFRFARPRAFQYNPGQWLYVTLHTEDSPLVKHFTISSSPTESEFIEFTKKITEHEFSMALNALQRGDRVRLNGPFGNFTFTGEYPKTAMITGGIGITPFRSMIKYCTDRKIPSHIILLYGNRNEESIVFQDELKDLATRNPQIKVIHCLSRPGDDWKGRRGHVDDTVVREEIPDYGERIFYVCGPPSLVTDLVSALHDLNIPPDRIRTEAFPGY
jgi:ferredoxin-NADP reductase